VEADRTPRQERATQRPEPNTTHTGTTLARNLLGIGGGRKARANRDTGDERILGELVSERETRACTARAQFGNVALMLT
jgi:hypothetical protein